MIYTIKRSGAGLLLSAGVWAWSAAPAPREVVFTKVVIDPDFRSEGAAVADVNRDGQADILAGNLWYQAPDWKPREIAPLRRFDAATGYSNSFLNFTLDLDRDGWPDQIVFGFPRKEAFWRRNPRGAAVHWKEHPIAPNAMSESPVFARLSGIGTPVLIFPHDSRSMAWHEPDQDLSRPFQRHLIGGPETVGIGAHGLGAGDVNGDGRPDVLTAAGYWEAPEDPRRGGWKFVPAQLGPDCAQMIVYDVDGDGLADVLGSSAHAVGVWWHQQRRGAEGPVFIRHPIDDSFSQAHALTAADINGDGLLDVVTGKRFWAHGPGKDVRPGDPCVLHWFELRRDGGKVRWIRHQIDDDSGVGTQFEVVDLNRDGRPDIVVANKKGVFLFRQRTAE